MRKLPIFIMILSILHFGIYVPTGAESFIELTPNNLTGIMTVSYTASAGYTVTIPASVIIQENNTGSATLEVSAYPITEDAKSVVVYLSGTKSYGKIVNEKFALYRYTDPDPALPYIFYTLEANGQAITSLANPVPLLTQPAGATEKATAELIFTLNGKPIAEGVYTDILTFEVGLE